MHLTIRKPLGVRSALVMKVVSFLIPLGVWCAVSYTPWIWHPQMKILDRGGTKMYRLGDQVDKPDFAKEQDRLAKAGKPPMQATPANPIFLPAPHEVGKALYTAFTTPPPKPSMPWFHERIVQSIGVLAYAFVLASVIAVPIGLLCGTFDVCSKAVEPFVDFMRYIPAPLFGALMMAVFGLTDTPKIAVIFIGLFFNMLLVTANTARSLDASLLEAAQTLGAGRPQLIWRVVLPGVLPLVYTDLRIALGFGWVYLAAAELIGQKSGITEFLDQNAKFRNYPNVFAAITVFGLIGFFTDQLLAVIGRWLFPWHARAKRSWFRTWILRIRAWRNDPTAAEQLYGRRLADVGA